jgi:hypothetical protein
MGKGIPYEWLSEESRAMKDAEVRKDARNRHIRSGVSDNLKVKRLFRQASRAGDPVAAMTILQKAGEMKMVQTKGEGMTDFRNRLGEGFDEMERARNLAPDQRGGGQQQEQGQEGGRGVLDRAIDGIGEFGKTLFGGGAGNTTSNTNAGGQKQEDLESTSIDGQLSQKGKFQTRAGLRAAFAKNAKSAVENAADPEDMRKRAYSRGAELGLRQEQIFDALAGEKDLSPTEVAKRSRARAASEKGRLQSEYNEEFGESDKKYSDWVDNFGRKEGSLVKPMGEYESEMMMRLSPMDKKDTMGRLESNLQNSFEPMDVDRYQQALGAWEGKTKDGLKGPSDSKFDENGKFIFTRSDEDIRKLKDAEEFTPQKVGAKMFQIEQKGIAQRDKITLAGDMQKRLSSEAQSAWLDKEENEMGKTKSEKWLDHLNPFNKKPNTDPWSGLAKPMDYDNFDPANYPSMTGWDQSQMDEVNKSRMNNLVIRERDQNWARRSRGIRRDLTKKAISANLSQSKNKIVKETDAILSLWGRLMKGN